MYHMAVLPPPQNRREHWYYYTLSLSSLASTTGLVCKTKTPTCWWFPGGQGQWRGHQGECDGRTAGRNGLSQTEPAWKWRYRTDVSYHCCVIRGQVCLVWCIPNYLIVWIPINIVGHMTWQTACHTHFLSSSFSSSRQLKAFERISKQIQSYQTDLSAY